MMNPKIRSMKNSAIEEPAEERADGPHQPLPELVEVLQKRHLAVGALLELEVGVVVR